jgi:hypothetical protein
LYCPWALKAACRTGNYCAGDRQFLPIWRASQRTATAHGRASQLAANEQRLDMQRTAPAYGWASQPCHPTACICRRRFSAIERPVAAGLFLWLPCFDK